MKRRSLLGAMLAACTAPAYVKAGILMPVRQIWTPPAVNLQKLALSNYEAYLGRVYDESFFRALNDAREMIDAAPVPEPYVFFCHSSVYDDIRASGPTQDLIVMDTLPLYKGEVGPI